MCEKCHDTGYLNGIENQVTGEVLKVDTFLTIDPVTQQPVEYSRTIDLGTGEVVEYKSRLSPGELARLFKYPTWVQIVQPCSCVVNNKANQRLEALKSTIPDDVKHFTTIDAFKHLEGAQSAVSAAAAIIEGYEVNINGAERPGVIFHGGTGTGKSSLAYVIYSHFLRMGVSVAWLDYRDLVNSIREMYGDEYRGQPLAGLCKPYAAATVLIVDEIGVETREKVMFEDMLEAMRLIFHPRYNQRMVTIGTTNLRPALLKHQLGDLVYSRMAGNCHFVEMVGVDLRAKV